MMLVKVASVGLLSIFLAACGIVDTELAQEAIDLKTQVLEIKTTQIDPLMEEIDTLSLQIDPLEREIEQLEQQREDLYDQGRELGNEFEKEMKKRFSSLFEADEDARAAFEEEFDEKYIRAERLNFYGNPRIMLALDGLFSFSENLLQENLLGRK